MSLERLLREGRSLVDLDAKYGHGDHTHHEFPDGRCFMSDKHSENVFEFADFQALESYLRDFEVEWVKLTGDPFRDLLRTEADLESALANLDDYLLNRWNIAGHEVRDRLEELNRKILQDQRLGQVDIVALALLQGELHIALRGGVWVPEECEGIDGARFICPVVIDGMTKERLVFQTTFLKWWDNGTPIQIMP